MDDQPCSERLVRQAWHTGVQCACMQERQRAGYNGLDCIVHRGVVRVKSQCADGLRRWRTPLCCVSSLAAARAAPSASRSCSSASAATASVAENRPMTAALRSRCCSS